MLQPAGGEAAADVRTAQAKALKEEGNELARTGRKLDAVGKYEKGIRLLGFPTYELDDEGVKALEGQTPDGRELLSALASNAAQMYMDPGIKQLGKAIERCTLALAANPANAKAYFRRATASLEHAENLAKGADACLARGQSDVRKFLQLDPGSIAGQALQERLGRKRQALMGPIMRERQEAPSVPEWFEQVRSRAIFVCMCGSTASGRDQVDLPDALLSMALQAKDKKAISVGVAYVGYKGPDELEMFNEEWQKKFYRMLKLGERATKVPAPRQVAVHGEVYSVWSLLDGRVRVMRLSEFRRSGERVSIGWARYCAQLLWHGEPFVYQSCRPYMRFAPHWDMYLKNDLAVALRRSPQKPLLSWMSRGHEDEPWQWVSDLIDYEDNCNVPTGALAAVRLDKESGWIQFRRRFFSHSFGVPVQVAFFSSHNVFSTSEVLAEVPADPFLNSLPLNAQLTCENVRLHSHGWDVYAPCVNVTWETTHDALMANRRLQGDAANEGAEDPQLVQAQRDRADAQLDPYENPRSSLDVEAMEAPLPTGIFWTALCPQDASPWDTSVGCRVQRFSKGTVRTLTTFERQTGVDLVRQELAERARNAGLNNDRDFEDAQVEVQAREQSMGHLRR